MIALHSASQQLDTMEQLEEELTCPICCGLFEDPRVLLCSHSFCKKCLEGLLSEAGSASGGVGGRGQSHHRTPFKCPTCRKETPHNGANSLQINYSLRGIVEKFSKLRVLPQMSRCAQHCGQPLNIFCATDLKLICGFCATTDEHRGHAFCSLEEAHEQEKSAFEELLRGVKSWRSADVLSRLETLQCAKKKALQCVTRDAEKASDYFDKVIGSLESKRSEIQSDFETLKLAVMQAFDPEITKLSAALEEQRRALNIAQAFRSAPPEPLGFLQHMQEFREKFRFLQETSPPPSSSGGRRRTEQEEEVAVEEMMDVGPLVRNFDVSKWDSLRLREVDKISVPHENLAASFPMRRSRPRMTSRKRITLMWMSVLVPVVLLLLQPQHLAAHAQPVFSALSTHLGHADAYLRGVTDMCTSLVGAGQECLVNIIDSTVTFIGSCKLL